MLIEAKHPAISILMKLQSILKVSSKFTFSEWHQFEVAGFFTSLRMTIPFFVSTFQPFNDLTAREAWYSCKLRT